METWWGGVRRGSWDCGGSGRGAGGVLSWRWSGGIWTPELWGRQGCSQTSIPTASPWTSWSVVPRPGHVPREPMADGGGLWPWGQGTQLCPLSSWGRPPPSLVAVRAESGGASGSQAGGDKGRPTFFLGEGPLKEGAAGASAVPTPLPYM